MITRPLQIGLIGFGAIGSTIARYAGEHPDELTVSGVLTRSTRPESSFGVEHVATLDDLLRLEPDIIVEAAGHEGLREHGARVLASGCDLVTVSVGAFADPKLEQELLAASSDRGARIRIPSGAIGGLDALAAACTGRVDRVVHTTTKPARTLLGAEAEGMTEQREIFHGTARDAARAFPESVNVVAAISLAGIGFDRTESSVIADPTIDRNIHRLECEGEFGSFQMELRNVPSEDNPKTARLAAMSVIALLLRERRTICF